jgi:hypothetical protein
MNIWAVYKHTELQGMYRNFGAVLWITPVPILFKQMCLKNVRYILKLVSM